MASEQVQKLLPIAKTLVDATARDPAFGGVGKDLRARFRHAVGDLEGEAESWRELAALRGRKTDSDDRVEQAVIEQDRYAAEKGKFNALVSQVEQNYVRKIVKAAKRGGPSHVAALLGDGSAAALEDFLLWIDEAPAQANSIVDQCLDDFREGTRPALERLADYDTESFGTMTSKLRNQARFVLGQRPSEENTMPRLSPHEYRDFIVNNSWSPAMVTVDVATRFSNMKMHYPVSTKAQLSARRPSSAKHAAARARGRRS
jgi:hypothetical protein